jgi:hypothetical protein
MTDKKALAEARKRWGKAANVQDRPKAPTAEQRAAAHEVMVRYKADRASVTREELLRSQGTALCYRYSVGEVTAYPIPLFHVRGQGDTWEEAFAEADRKAAKV